MDDDDGIEFENFRDFFYVGRQKKVMMMFKIIMRLNILKEV